MFLIPTRSEHPTSDRVKVMSEDQIAYEELIAVMDLCLLHGFVHIAVDGAI